MLVPAVKSGLRRRVALLVGLLIALVPMSFAQPGNNSPDQYGDRQTGHWGDPGTGHFGNPAVGNFDNSLVREPAPGTKPLGRVSGRKLVEGSPYVSLPAPVEAAVEKKAVNPGKPTNKSKSASKKKVAS